MKNNKYITTGKKEDPYTKTTVSLAVAVQSTATVVEVVNRPIRRRRRNYAKKIMNDPFIMSV